MGVSENPQRSSFEQLAMPLFNELYSFARWLAGNTAEAEDLVQETYVKALRGFSSFQSGTNFRGWMYRILRNTFLTSRTGLRATSTVPLDLEDDEVAATDLATPESIFLQRADQALVQDAMAELPVHFREVLLLCDGNDMSYQEIAQTLGVPIGTVMSRLFRARKALRTALQDKLGRK
jgi:RNA polymerase sigma-70 factor (ECF subfamily)